MLGMGMSRGWAIFCMETVSILHLCLFWYFCAIAQEHYYTAADDPKMIDIEHKRQAEIDKKAAEQRKKQKLEAKKKASKDEELGKPLLNEGGAKVKADKK